MRSAHKTFHHIYKYSVSWCKKHTKTISYSFIGIFSLFIILTAGFITLSPNNPHASELSFTERSVHGIGSVIPASCNSVPPTSHFAGDCALTEPCSGGTPVASWYCTGYYYYFDNAWGEMVRAPISLTTVSGTAVQAEATCSSITGGNYSMTYIANSSSCPVPAPTITASISPTTYVSYGGTFDSLSYTSTNAVSCTGSINGGAPWATDLSHTWASSGSYTANTTWTFTCTNSVNVSTSTSVTLQVCPKGYTASSGSCVNNAPTVTISPTTLQSLPLGQAITFTSVATDASSDITSHTMEWQTPSGASNTWGTISYTGSTSYPSGTNSSSLSALFTPDHVGQYRVRFAAQDNTFSNFNGLGTRTTYSAWTYLNVINGTTAIIYPDPTDSSKLKWECFNSDLATLATTGGSTVNDFTNKTVPPASGTFTPSQGATYTLTCKNTASNQTATFSYSLPSLTSSNVGSTNATIAWNCNNASARSVLLERLSGTNIAYNSPVANRTDNDLSPSTEYLYTLRCFDGLGATGNQIGTASIRVTTTQGAPATFTLSAYIRNTSADSASYSSAQPITALTPDGQFYDWSYRITGGTAQSCVMDQRNDGDIWYPSPAYASDPSGYTFAWSSLSTSEKSSFANSFGAQHDWRLTCTDSQGRTGSLIWSLIKSDNFPTVIDASLNPHCSGGSPTITVQCANSDYFDVKNSGNSIIGSGGTSGVVTLPGEGTYKVVCKQGGASGTASREVLRTYSASMCTASGSSFTASPVSLQSGGLSTVKWTIANPSASCVMSAAPVCAGSCSAARTAEAAAITTGIADGSILTDANDINNINGIIRSVKDAVQTEAFNNGVAGQAIGKKTFRLNYTTDFQIQCGANIQKLRVLITNDNEG